jgi:murein DD-endopeptidase MepM/ murein hydrolase activator NlpD
MFRKRRAGLRNIVVPVAAIAAVYAGLSFFNSAPQTDSAPQFVQAAAPVVAPQPNTMLAATTTRNDSSDLKAAFDSTPTAPSYDFAARREEAAAPKPQVVMAEQPTPALQRQISYIQSGLTKLLQDAPASPEVKEVSVGKGDTLMDLLVRNNVPREQAYNAIAALSKIYDPRDLNPGHAVTVFFHQDPSIADPQFSGLKIQRDTVNAVVVARDGAGNFVVNKEAKAIHKNTRAFKGKIGSSLYVDAKEQGVPDSVILELIKMYSWGVDFQREIQQGDTFEVLYEEYMTDDGSIVPGRGEVIYAQLGLSGRDMPLYRYEDRNGDADYFDPSGASAKKPLMKTPIDGARLSSGFGMRRHPVLGYNKMHKGIDFAAPRGTPIYAAGDGVVEKAGPFSSYGNYVRIRHRSGLETAYAHMSRVACKSGTRVKQGSVIGYVGTTGRSTGPHLHYEILIGGKQVNPAAVKLAGGRELAGKDLKAFKAAVAARKGEFSAALAQQASGNVASR